MSSFTVEANRFQTPTPDHLEAGRVVISAVDGEITAVEQSGTEAAQALTEASADHRVLRDNQVLTPGFIDLHLHAPQWQQNGTALDLPLDEWLFTYTFPLEASFADRAVAEAVYPDLVATLLGHGTTTAAYLSSVHDEATAILAETCVAQGQRAFVGRVAMDHPTGTPDFYRDHDAVSGIDASRRSITDIAAIDAGRGPGPADHHARFAPACTDEMLAGLGRLAEETGTLVQTHCSESDWEHNYAFERFGTSDTEALDAFGLLREHTLLAREPCTSERHRPDRRTGCGDRALSDQQRILRQRRAAASRRAGTGRPRRPGHRHRCRRASRGVPADPRRRDLLPIRQDGVDARKDPDARGVPDAAIDTVTGFWLATAGAAEAAACPSVCWSRDAGSMRSCSTSTPRVG